MIKASSQIIDSKESLENDFLTVREVAVILKKAVKTIYYYFETGVFPEKMIYRFGNSPRIKRQDLYRLIESQKGI